MRPLRPPRAPPPPSELQALCDAADPAADRVDRHLWLVRLFAWLRRPAPTAPALTRGDNAAPPPVLRLRQLLDELDRRPAVRSRVLGLLAAFWQDIDAPSLFADFGFGARVSLHSELLSRLAGRVLPKTPDTTDLASLFEMLCLPADAAWIEAVDPTTLQRVAALVSPGAGDWRSLLLAAITILVSAVQAAGHAPALRRRMDPALLRDGPFRQLAHSADQLRIAVLEGRHDDALREARVLRALLAACRRAAGSVTAHLEQYGVSVDIVYGLDQLSGRTARIEQLVDCVLAPAAAAEWQRLLAELVRVQAERLGVRALLGQHTSLLARQVAERSAESGEHYITRNRAEHRAMLRRAAGGGVVLAGTTLLKFGIATLALGAFWSGFWSSLSFAASFVVVVLLHWTVATKLPAMTAPALAASLAAVTRAPPGSDGGDGQHEAIEAFVDRVVQLIRSQAAGIAGNLALCGPLVLGVQAAWNALFDRPLVGVLQASHVLDSLTLLGPTPLFAALTGGLLFVSSLAAGWAENWFVFHRLDSAIAFNPRVVARLGALRARRWAAWWRANVSGVAASVSLGLLLGMVPAVGGFFGLGVDVRHVTLASGQLGAALGAYGWGLLVEPAFWWCVAGIASIGVLNVGVSFWLAFKVALRSRGVRVKERGRIAAAVRRRLWREPLSFLWPTR